MPSVRRSNRLPALAVLALALGACQEKAPAADTSRAPAAPAPAAAPAPPPVAASPDSFRVAFETSRGNFVVQVDRAWSPKGADRFYEMVNRGYFTDVRFFRVVPGFIAQFGMHGDPKINDQWKEKTIADDPVIQSNKRGTLTFATHGANTRSNQFFINFADNGPLDANGFTPFAHVISGMDVVDKIYSGYGEQPDQAVIATQGNAYLTKQFPKLDYIKSAKVVPATTAAAR